MIVPSRSGPTAIGASEIISELTSQGIRVYAPRCDVLSVTELDYMLKGCRDMPPIRGCINAAMALQVRRNSQSCH